ncbi:glycine cleavage system aminomethyltransferase GcvT [Paraclostridium bifermentans]|uniref:glycine cleavage system aminomethyltransferase GcvT n=1 Tax=Paraclostridium bifermentans TaxID=1490 RepID=UPI0025B19E2B|nr:glycine cleavage system aminomethyltransferase GcvT [Paraclostridium bifermentans]
MENLKKTYLLSAHEALGAKMIDFAGWYMPLEYEGLIKEHESVRNYAGLFDVSHMGEIIIKGAQAKSYLQNLITNDIEILEDNQAIYTFMCYPNGGVVDDLLVYRFDENNFYLVINASNIEKDFKWMNENKQDYDIEIENISSEISELAIQGPLSQRILQEICDENLDEIKSFYFNKNIKVDQTSVLISRTGYTGEDGFEIYCKNEDVGKIWNKLLEVGEKYKLKPCGLGCRDTLRFEAGLPLYGNELSEAITPLEAGFSFFVKLDKGNFIGKNELKMQKEKGLNRKLIGFELTGKGIARQGYEVMVDDNVIGYVTTGYKSPTLNKSIGFALIDASYSEIGKDVDICIRKKKVKAKIINKRFYKKPTEIHA